MGDYIDSCDLIEELEDEDLDPDRRAAIEALADEVGGEWEYGVQMIPVEDFPDYARELAKDIGAISRDAEWPLRCIDWEQAARELSQDYNLITFDGSDYYVPA